MPFRSRAQEIYLAINNPKVAHEFSAKTPSGTKLPQYVPGSKAKGASRPKMGGRR